MSADGRSREFPAWGSALGLVTLGFLSATMGLQGIMGKVRYHPVYEGTTNM